MFVEKATGTNHVPYGKLGESGWTCAGLPEGVMVRNPGSLGKSACKAIIEAKSSIAFVGKQNF